MHIIKLNTKETLFTLINIILTLKQMFIMRIHQLKQLIFAFFLFLFINKSNAQTFTTLANLYPATINDIAITDDFIFAVGNDGALYKSLIENAANMFSFPTVIFPDAGSFKGIRFLNNTTGFMWTTNGKLFKTSDAGMSWDTLSTNTTDTINECSFLDDSHFFMLTNDKIYKTDNSGTSWSLLNSPTDSNFRYIIFISNTVGFSITKKQPSTPFRSKLYKTSNGGSSWTQVFYQDSADLTKLVFIDNMGFIIYGPLENNFGSMWKSGIYKTTNLGDTWNVVPNAQSFQYPIIYKDICSFNNNSVLWLKNDIYNQKTYFELFNGVNTTTFDHLLYATNPRNTLLRKSAGFVPYFYFISTEGGTNSSLCRFAFEHLQFKELTFFDASINYNSSNPLNILSPSQRVRFKVKIENKLTSNLLTLSGKLHVNSPYITITDSVVTYNNLTSGQQALSSDELEIQLSSNIPNNHVAYFTLELNDQIVQGGPWESYFQIPIVFNPFDISNNIIDDDNIPDSDGNNNDIAEADETIEIIPLMDNNTTHSFSNVEGYLFSPYPEIVVWNDTMGATETVYNHYSYGALNSGAQNIPPAKDFVFTNNFDSTYNLAFEMIMTGKIDTFNGSTKYKDIVFRWVSSFVMNSGYPNPPNMSVRENSEIVPIKVYPVPARDYIVVDLPKDACIEILNASGQVIKELNFNKKICIINTSNLESGTYLMRIITKDNIFLRKIIIQ